MLLSLELELLQLRFLGAQASLSPQMNSPAGVPVGVRPYLLPATVHVLL